VKSKPMIQNPNAQILQLVDAALGNVANDVVYIGGCAAGLLVTDTGASPVRATLDVDILVQVAALSAYGDYLARHNMEDIVVVVDGRDTIAEDIAAAANDIRMFLGLRFSTLLADSRLVEAVSAHFPPDAVSQAHKGIWPLTLEQWFCNNGV
jgi:hypothetical protein